MTEHVYVAVSVGGMNWYSFTRITAQASAKQAVRSFAFTATDDTASGGLLSQAWNFMPGEVVTVTANGDLILIGYINNLTPSYDANNHHIEVSGRSKGQDSVDSSAEHDKGEFKDKTPLQIATELDKYNIGFKSKAKGMKKIEWFRLNPGETAHEAIARACHKQGIRQMGKPDGSIELVDSPTGQHAPLIEGVNIIGASATFSDSDQHSEIKIKGQRTFGTGKGSLRIEEKAKNSKVKRNRKLILRPEADITKEEAQKRVKHHKNMQLGDSVQASVRVQGWHDDGGALWEPNRLVHVYSPMLKLDMLMGVQTVNWQQDASGSFTQLGLVHPAALGSDSSSGGGPWGAG